VLTYRRHAVYLAAHHDARILRVDKVLAYHFGTRYLCEVDVVLPESMPLKETHDIGEVSPAAWMRRTRAGVSKSPVVPCAQSLEIRIEALPMVERAFVHCDYEYTHKAEHKAPL
jgi:hypothetical protein